MGNEDGVRGTAAPDAGHVIWLEAERFSDYGGWSRDDQFIDLMGSSYLMAHGLGQPVTDATTAVAVESPGEYRIWVRSKDWFPSHHPGRFQVLVDGQPLRGVFGASGIAGWHWEDGGTVHLSAGQVQLSLRDVTGYNGRCDALLLTDDVDFQPGDDAAAVEALRRHYDPVQRERLSLPRHDVVIVGGGLAGCTAAVAAARNGASVALLQNRPVLGGNASTEILVPPVGLWPHGDVDPLNPRETGLVEEYRTIGNQRVAEGKFYEQRLHRFVENQTGIDLFLCTHATGAEMTGDPEMIAAVLAMDTRTGRRLRFEGDLFIDCSGDSVVALSAGADYRTGKESKTMHNEPWAPQEANAETMGNGLKYASCDTGNHVPFEVPEWAFAFPSCQDFAPRRHPRFDCGEAIGYQWQIELGGLRDTFADAEEIRDDLLRLIFGIWDHVKNRCPRFRDQGRSHRLSWVGTVAGKRENRRLLGDVILTQNDIAQRTLFRDRVAYGAWVVDDHHSAGFFHDGSFGKHEDDRAHAYQGVEFSIPFGALYSRNLQNLLMAGRNISATHLAMSDTRVMLTCAIMGHAVGTAAALCHRYQLTPRTLREQRLDDLQQLLLKEGATIPRLQAHDPNDLAQKAIATASSEGRSTTGEAMAAGNVLDGIARADGESRHAWAPAVDAPSPHWIELRWKDAVVLNSVHITFQTAWDAPEALEVQVQHEDEWRTVAAVTENRHRRLVFGIGSVRAEALRVHLDEVAAVCEIRVYKEPEEVVRIQQLALRTMRMPDVEPMLPFQVEEARGGPFCSPEGTGVSGRR